MAQRILVVDDEEHIRFLIKTNLERAGYEVITAPNGRLAVETAQAFNPDLVVMDVMMPEMDGLEAMRILKADDATSAIPVVLLTAKGQDSDVFEGWQSGADLYLTKPFHPRELLLFIKRILDNAEEMERSNQTFEVTDLDEE
ncbi:response regulator [bacterium]|nr:MAG: response regulator [bacterium]